MVTPERERQEVALDGVVHLVQRGLGGEPIIDVSRASASSKRPAIASQGTVMLSSTSKA